MNRRTALGRVATPLAIAAVATLTGCEKRPAATRTTGPRGSRDEEYVWISANANLPLFTAADHPALELAGQELGVRVTKAGPNSIDIPSLVAAIEQTTARRPAGIMVVGWDPSALVPPINAAIDAGVPVVCVDADVPASKRLSFIGTNWRDIGVQQAQVMLRELGNRRGKIAMLGLIEQTIDQEAFEGFRSVAVPAGLEVLEPQQDKGNQAEAARVAAAIIQGTPDLVGMAGFDSESGPGIGQAIKEANRVGKIVGTTVQAEGQMLRFIKEGVMAAAVMQKRHLFTYQGVKALFEVVHSPLRFTADDKRAGVIPIPVNYSTGTFVITRQNVELFLNK